MFISVFVVSIKNKMVDLYSNLVLTLLISNYFCIFFWSVEAEIIVLSNKGYICGGKIILLYQILIFPLLSSSRVRYGNASI